jgi:CRISPR-associated endoribonuclease Cas6
MLSQLDFTLQTGAIDRVQSELAVKVHGALMHMLPADDAAALHRQERHPYALFLYPSELPDRFLGRLTALTDSMQRLTDIAADIRTLPVHGLDRPALWTVQEYRRGLRFSELPVSGGRVRTLRFLTPAVYKLNSKPCSFPDLPRLFHSAIAKLWTFEQISVSEEDFRLACQEMFVSDWGFERVEYNITGRMQQSMIGFMSVQLPQDAAQAALLNTVFSYAAFSGVGARTSLGMGGFLYL